MQVRDEVTEDFLAGEDDEDDDMPEGESLSNGVPRTLASIFESDDELIEVDAEQTDETLMVCSLAPVHLMQQLVRMSARPAADSAGVVGCLPVC